MQLWSGVFTVVLTLNVIWFFMGFWYFTIKSDAAAKLLVPKSARESPLFSTLSASVRFLGAMNFAFALMAALVLANLSLFDDARQGALLAGVFAVTHAGQFLCNVPIAMGGGRRGESLWNVLNGPMAFIFAVDFALMFANASVCVGYSALFLGL
jgi:hypothetical protein